MQTTTASRSRPTTANPVPTESLRPCPRGDAIDLGFSTKGRVYTYTIVLRTLYNADIHLTKGLTMKATCYHSRLFAHHPTKVVGGSITADSLDDAADYLVSQHTVTVKPSGRAIFVDREGREVNLYLSIEPAETAKGQAALRADREERELAERIRAEHEAAQQLELAELLRAIDTEEAIRRLKGD